MVKRLIVIISTIFIFPTPAIFSSSLKNNLTKEKESIPEWIYPAPFKYDIKNLPDPFIPFIKKSEIKREKHKKENKNLTPLQRIDPSQLKLIGIVYSKRKTIPPMALVELPDKKSYILKEGTKIGTEGAYVKKIFKSQVNIVEPTIDVFGKEKYKNIILKLHKKEGE